MLAMLLATALLIAACFAIGQAIVFLCGWRAPKWWAPAVGYGVLMIVFGQAIHFPNHQRALLALVLVAAVGSLALPFVRRAFRAGVADGLLLGIGLLLLAAIPFFATGYAGILGPNLSDDMSQHLTAAWWLHDSTGMLPVAAIGGNLVTTGYPLGPHALAAAFDTLGLGDVRGFSALTLAVPVITGFVAAGLVPQTRRGARWALAAAVGLGYLPAAYLAQGSFKEIILAMLVLAAAAVLGDLSAERGRIGWRLAVPLSVLIGGAVYTYSYGALLWMATLILFFLGAEMIRRRELFALVRDWAACGVTALVVGALVVAPEIHRMRLFRQSIFGQESLRNKGNLSHPLNPLETLGVWFNGDFRFNPQPRWITIVFCVIALAALVRGLVWWWRCRSLAVPAGVVAAIVVWANLALTVNIYNAAKGLLVLAPLVTACLGVPLAAAWSAREGPVRRWSWVWIGRVTGVVLFAGAVVASGGVLRSAPVGLDGHDQEFAQIRPLVRHKAVMFLDNDHFGQWELRGARPLYTTNALYAPKQLGQHPAKLGGLPIDADNYGRPELDKLDYLVVSGGKYRSQIPPNFRLAMQTRSYDVFKRVGPTPDRQPIEEPGHPGTVFDCNSEKGKRYLQSYPYAGVLPRPVVSTAWRGSIGKPGQTGRVTVKLPRGLWDVSLQYLSRVPVTVRAPGLTKQLAPNFGVIESYWPAGTVTSDGRPVTLSVTAAQRNWFGHLLGGPRPTRAALSPGDNPLYHVAFTRHGETPKRIHTKNACGRYVDWFAPAGSTMRGR